MDCRSEEGYRTDHIAIAMKTLKTISLVISKTLAMTRNLWKMISNSTPEFFSPTSFRKKKKISQIFGFYEAKIIPIFTFFLFF